ncbi:MAG: ABC transporter permease [Bacteroidales bacterium]|nr:ABC transporter permease [Clostridium sp.]MCM1204235.1 ABC transporter permease [Bacteroidales bacterium]
MLFKKMLRETKKDWVQAFSVFLLSALAVMMFCTFEGHVFAQNKARTTFHEKCRLAELWVYGEGFDKENLEAVRNLDFVEEAQLRMSVTGSAPDCDGAQVDLFLERENLVNVPYRIDGEDFNPQDTEGVWLTNAFAKLRNIKVGDDFTIEYNGITFTRRVKGLIESAEYEYRQAEGDADMYIENIAFVYLSYDAFPVREYVTHLIEQGKITAEDITENTDALDEQLELLRQNGMDVSDITKETLLEFAEKIDDEQLAKIMPYTQMIIKTKDGSALSREEEIGKALNHEYAVMVDKSSIAGIARLDSELSQHESFSYVFVIIFVGIAVLVISTSVSRMVERQRTQIGTLNALGMKKVKVFFHYISSSFFFSLLGVTAGALVGSFLLSPVMVNMFSQWYIVPGLEAGFDVHCILIGGAVVVICALSSYLSCRKILRIKPAEALRPAPPKNGKHCIFEKLPFWGRLGFISQYNLRDISRAKLRAAMCVCGTAVGMMLMLYGTGCSVLVDDMVNMIFKVQSAEWQVKLSEDAVVEELDSFADDLSGELIMVNQIEVAKAKNAPSADREKETLTVVEGKGLYHILDEDKNVLSLESGNIGVSRKLAQDMDIKAGDEIYWHLYMENDWHKSKVGLIYQSNETQGITLLRKDYEKTGEKYMPTWMFSNSYPEGLADKSYVVSVNGRQEIEDAYRNSMEVISILVWAMLIFSVILIVVVLYNSGNLSFNERIREFATLKVMGMQSGKIRRILSVQNLWLSLLGIILGAPLGKLSLNAMMNSNGDNFDYNLTLKLWCYIISGILVLAVSVLISFFFSKRIRKIDMVDVLKGVE